MIITSIIAVNKPPILSLHDENIKMDFGSVLIEIDKEAFKRLVASLLLQASAQGLDLTVN